MSNLAFVNSTLRIATLISDKMGSCEVRRAHAEHLPHDPGSEAHVCCLMSQAMWHCLTCVDEVF